MLFCPFSYKSPTSSLKTQEPNMEAPVALNVAPLNAPHKDLDWLPLADRDFQIKELSGDMNHLQAFFRIRNSHLRNSDNYGIWESNLPKYYLPSVKNVMPTMTLSVKQL